MDGDQIDLNLVHAPKIRRSRHERLHAVVEIERLVGGDPVGFRQFRRGAEVHIIQGARPAAGPFEQRVGHALGAVGGLGGPGPHTHGQGLDLIGAQHPVIDTDLVDITNPEPAVVVGPTPDADIGVCRQVPRIVRPGPDCVFHTVYVEPGRRDAQVRTLGHDDGAVVPFPVVDIGIAPEIAVTVLGSQPPLVDAP